MDNNSQLEKNLSFEHGENGEIRPLAFMKKETMNEEIWDEEKAQAASDTFKMNYIEEVSTNAMMSALRVLAAGGLCNLDGDDVMHIIMTMQSIKALACRSAGMEHPFHAVPEKIIQEPSAETRRFIGIMVMTADGTLTNPRTFD